ncbi:TetR/AcrR family transcriptional regulator [Frankia sp. QA3]|uniref:TetR/AcrR family transcriptional regulator n=1 Tax=Frankia sp. QA3 TaxID=710111 RepID=UPI000269BE24|nr:TetR/AcrR family transcriptional regulator [Frankia sp. QA3]EIV91433.1 transcriptional regulator [Frankia sp. QA3]
MRVDARLNRERILAAAEEVFGELGAQASTEEVARRAGVGVATVFRHFPTKTDLVEATLVRHFDDLVAHARTLAAAPAPGAALGDLVTAMIERGATKVTLANLLGAADQVPSGAADAAHRLRDAVDAVLRRAQDAGVARTDVSVDELYFLVRGLTQAAAALPVPAAVSRGAVAIVLDGLAANPGGGSSPRR